MSRATSDLIRQAAVRVVEPAVHDDLTESLRIRRPNVVLPSAAGAKVPAPLAARVAGTVGHAHASDDTQVPHDHTHVCSPLTHPAIPLLMAALIIAEQIGLTDDREGMLTSARRGCLAHLGIERPEPYERISA